MVEYVALGQWGEDSGPDWQELGYKMLLRTKVGGVASVGQEYQTFGLECGMWLGSDK